MSTKNPNTESNQNINTDGGSHISGNVDAGRDVVMRDQVTVNNYYQLGLRSDVNVSTERVHELFMNGIRLHLDGKLVEALAVYEQVKDIIPTYPRILVHIQAV